MNQQNENIRVYRGEGEYSSEASEEQDESYAYTPQLSRSDFEARARPHEEWRQKVGSVQPEPRLAISPGQRLALAIVSVSVLAPLVAILIEGGVSSDNAGNPLIIGSRLLGLLLVCLTIMVVNVTFNRHR